MEEINLDYIEDLITYYSVFGKDREVYTPAIVDYISKGTILKESNFMILDMVAKFVKEHNYVPQATELRCFVVTDEDQQRLIQFIKGAKEFKKNEPDRLFLTSRTEEFFKQRITNEVLQESFIKTTANEPIDIVDIYSRIEDAMGIHMVDDIGLNLFADADDYCEVLTNEEARIQTGHEWLDRQLGGGLLASGSSIYNFVAASNIGKSNFIKTMACNISRSGKSCLVISLEMPRYIYANRFVSELADINIAELKEASDEIGTFLKAAKSNGYGDILIKDFATGSITPQAMGSYIKRAEKHLGIKFDVIFVDYPELLKPSRNYAGRHDLTITNLYVETRALSFVLEAPFVVVSQLNRDGYNKENPSMENIGGAIGIAQCSDFCGFLHATDEMKAINMISCKVGKSRFGPVNQSKKFNVCEHTLKITEANGTEDLPVNVEEAEEIEEAEDFFSQYLSDKAPFDADEDDEEKFDF